MRMRKNVLLLCLSMTKTKDGREQEDQKEKDSLYSYTLNGEERQVEGYLTNEAPAKSTIQKLDAMGERLDDIIVICSDSVCKPVLNDKNRSQASSKYMERREKVLEKDRERFEELTHIELYESLIHRYSGEVNEDYGKKPIAFHKIYISDDAAGPKVAEAAVKAADFLEVQGDGETVNLYIDYNGGQRYMAFMIVAVANLAKVRGVEVKEILTMNYEQKAANGGNVPIQNMKGVFGCIDLVAGVHEYINYGRIRMLDAYFKDSPNKEIKNILYAMRRFSHEMQLCNTDYVLAQRHELRKKLEQYKADAAERTKRGEDRDADTYEVLFSYVVNDILNGYRILFEGDLPEIIKWCIEKDYVQQALTFYAEQMPIYFWNEGIFAPTEEEEKEYNDFFKFCKEQNKKEFSNYDEKYCWLVKFLLNSYKYQNSKDYGYKSGQLMNEKLKRRKITQVAEEKGLFDEKEANDVESIVGKMMYALEFGRAASVLNRPQLTQVLADYFHAKQLRNATNHADGQRAVNKYEAVCRFVGRAMDDLGGFVKRLP